MNTQSSQGSKQIKAVMLGPTLLQQGGVAAVENLILRYPPTNVEIQHISTHEEGSLARRVMVFVWGLMRFFWQLSSFKIDLVHIHFAERGSAFRKAIALPLALLFRQPVILHAHGSEFHAFYTKLPEWLKQVMAGIFRQCTYLIVLSESWKEFYTTNLGLKSEQVVVLTNPVEMPATIPQRAGKESVNFVFLGRIGQRKGAFDLIRAFSMLPSEQQSKSTLILAGDGEVESARQLIESLNLGERITVLDWINTQQRNELLAKADVFVLPSYNEGLPMALLEAMSWGLSVITTPVGGIPEVVTQSVTGLLVNPGNIQELSDALKLLIEDQNLRLSLGTNARARVAPFDVKNYSLSLGDIYRKALEKQLLMI